MKTRPPQVQSFTLQFIEKYLILLGRKKHELSLEYLKECKLVEILFSDPLFEVVSNVKDPRFDYEKVANETWNSIWKQHIYTDIYSLSWICKSIVDTVKVYNENIAHLVKLNKWIQDQAVNDSNFVGSCINSGLIEGLLGVINTIKKTQKFTEHLIDFFVTIKVLLGQFQGTELQNSGILMDLLMQDSYISDSDCSDLCMTCLTYILRFQNDQNYKKFGNLLKTIQTTNIKLKLLGSMQGVLQENDRRKRCQQNFLKAKMLETLKDLLTNCPAQDPDLISLWVNCLECVRFLIIENPTCKKSLQEFDFSQVADVLRNKLYSVSRGEIYSKSIESVLFILFETKNLGRPVVRPVRTPEVIPLVIELLTDCEQVNEAKEYFKHLSACLEDCYNAAHFANYRTTDLLLDAFDRTSCPFLLEFISSTLPLVICHHITPQELNKIIESIRKSSNNPKKQGILFTCLANGVKNSCCFTDHYKFQANHTCLSSTRYFCFRFKKSMLKCQIDPAFNLIPNKDFSIFFWVYPDTLSENSELLVLSGAQSGSLILSLISGQLVFQYFQENNIFTVQGQDQLIEKQWNLIGISVKSLSGLLFKSDRIEVEIFINTEKIQTKVTGKLTRPKEILSTIYIGNSEQLINGFKGRVLSIFILKKFLTLNHFREIYFLSFQYNLGFNPEAISTSEVIQSDKASLKYIFENITFQWHPRSRVPEVLGTDKLEIVDECERFNGVSIIEAIAANGGLKIFLPLIKDCKDRKGVISLLTMIAEVCIAQSVEMVLDEEFFGLLTFILEQSVKKPDAELVDALINIVGHLEWNPELHLHSFRCLFFNKRLWKDLDQETHSHYTGVLSLNIKKHSKCDPDTLYRIYDQLSTVQQDFSESFLEIWQNIIPETIDSESIDGILLLIFTMFEKNQELLLSFISMLSKKTFKKDSFEPTHYSLLYLMKELSQDKAQSCILKFVLKLCEDYCEEMAKEKKMNLTNKEEFEFINVLGNSIDRCLGNDILLESFEELLGYCMKAVDAGDKRKGENFISFFDIITRRLPSCRFKKNFIEKILRICESEEFAILVYDRESFPGWLLMLYFEVPEEVKDLAIRVFTVCAKSRNFNKLRNFITQISSQKRPCGLTWAFNFFSSLLHSLNNEIFLSGTYENPTGKSTVIHFLDYLGILEDILSIHCSGESEIDVSVYIPVLQLIFNTAESFNMISSTYPPIPLISFDLLLSCLRESPIIPLNDSSIYLRDGGFLRLILKFIFLGLSTKQDVELIKLLKRVLKGGQENLGYLTISNESRNRWESRFSSVSYEKFTDFYVNLRECRDETIHSVKFLTQYIIAECTEILVHDMENPILEFLKEFIRDTEALTEIDAKTKLSDFELECFYRLIIDRKLDVHSTARSRISYTQRNKNIYFLTNFSDHQRTDPKNFISEMKDLFSRYKIVKDSQEGLLNLLTSEQWTSKIHFFFIASTSMKLNFVSSVRTSQLLYLEPKTEDSFEKIQKFVDSKKIQFTGCKQLYEQRLDRTRRMAQKIYNEFCNNVEDLKLILNGSQVGKFRLKQVLDGMGRMVFIEKSYQPLENPQLSGRNRVSLLSPHHLILPFFKNTEENEELGVSSEEENTIIDYSYNVGDVFRVDCERITVNSSVFGFLEFSQDYLLYISEGKEKPKDSFYFGSALEFTIQAKKTEKIWKISEIEEVFLRRFIHTYSAFEIFFTNGKTAYFNVFNEEICTKAMDYMKSWQPKYGKKLKDPKSLFQFYKKLWVKNQLSNMEYLLILNKLSSRSFNDISQYPIFPWVLSDYTSSSLKLENSVYRNLSLPIGAQTQLGQQEASRKYSMFIDEDVESFNYGSHYSSAGIVLHYLVRLDPFTDLAKSLQGGAFDVADRLFYSIEAAWESGQGTTGDVKELIPELFYLPEMFLNLNKEGLGVKQDSRSVNHVELPLWANSPIDFVIKHRKALESWYVSSHLNEWIDLIFGFKQKGQLAIENLNVFSSISYEDKFRNIFKSVSDQDTLQGYVEQVVHFGQTPVQLLKSAHPAKEFKQPGIGLLDKWKLNEVSLESDCFNVTSPIKSLLSSPSGIWSIRVVGSQLYVCRENTLDKTTQVKLEGARDMNLLDWEEAVQWNYSMRSGANLVLIKSPEQYCLWGDELIVSGFHLDNSFKIHTLKGQLLQSIHHHAGLVTCVTSIESFLFTGSMDTSIASWSNLTQKFDKIKPFNIYLGHSEAIRQLAVQEKYSVLLSLSVNGILLMHEMRSARCLRKISYASPIRIITTSELGLVSVYIQKIGVKIFTINGTDFIEHFQISNVKILKFSENGEFLIVGTSTSILLFDILDPDRTQNLEIFLDDNIKGFDMETFVFSGNKEQLFIAFNSSSESRLLRFK